MIERNCVQLKGREMSTLKVSEIVLSAVCLGTQEAFCLWFTSLLFNNSQLVSTASANDAVPQITPLVCNTSHLSICYQPLPLGIAGNNIGPNSQNTLAQWFAQIGQVLGTILHQEIIVPTLKSENCDWLKGIIK